ncbi:uncharacterized protein LOC115631276 isoform X2 [Scaptodrosophila lebanonensis]|uniref:Uncharacterized protein LOC115631276 isoform X2 n=1 Tax=Drosophila lebanonensis TaxID=7225 RepID=A0A6J2U6A4_DROLE|nr:uncharacterized protein LOC115631276 isoform X2 [Scaptodrosophila lebanonensis]
MSPKYHHFEIALIYFLLLIPWPPTNVIKILCSRDSSRLVRKIVRSKWTPILDKHQVKLPLECPLHPFRDVFAPRQDAKQRDRPTQWTCRMCGKSFYQEKHLDLHFDTRHKSIINEAEDSVCLADFCDIMRCEVFQTEDSSSLKFGDQHIVTDIEVWGDSLGQNSALAKANAAYLSLIPIRTSTLGATRAAKVQNRQLIQDKQGQSNEQSQSDAAAQDAGTAKLKSASEMLLSKLKGLGQKRQETDGTESVDEAQVNDTEQKSNDGNDDPNATQDEASVVNSDENASASNMSKVRANCKAEDLSKLKARCEYLLRSCIGSLLLSMSDQAFKEMEEEMNKAVCWYLTCDRYWEDGPLEPRAFPWGLIVILIFVLSTGICFCYYIIWILFDSEETTINANNHYGYGTVGGVGSIGSGIGSGIYMPARHYHVDYAMPRDIDGLGGRGLGDGGPMHGMTAEQQQQQQQYYYQQQQAQQQAARDLYPEPVQYHRHSPRHYISTDQRQAVAAAQAAGQQGTPTVTGAAGVRQSASNASTPLHHHHQQQQPHLQHHRHSTSLGYPQDILDRRDYTSSVGRPIATSVVSSSSSVGGNIGGTRSTQIGAAGDTTRHYNTHPRPLDTRHRHVGSSQQSLRASSSTHEIVQSEVGQNEHYIYVTYPPDLKKRYFDKYE